MESGSAVSGGAVSGSAAGRIRAFYDREAQREWERLDRHRTELAVTRAVLRDHLPPPPAAILDAGGGPGRYALALAQDGYRVTLLDLSPVALELARRRAAELGVELAAVREGNATDLGPFPAATFEAVLLLGPLYHLLGQQERAQAVQEARRVLRPGGVLFAAFLTRYAPLRYIAKRDPARLVSQRQRWETLLATGILGTAGGTFTDVYGAAPTEIRPFMEPLGFETVELVACEGVVSMIDEQLNSLQGELWDTWVALNRRLGTDPSVHGAAEHLLYVG
ncbi:MAG TPA: methyltransferase domain-containing protein, partial [Chloroflexota bacterium]|nr:methyltransferase domain-containing protein [Chloroflexota bacterium]